MLDSARTELFFDDIVRAYVDAPRFLRRDWLATDLYASLDQPNTRYASLTAEPGAGKSSFVAQLAHDHPDWLRYFIRRDQCTALGEKGPRSFLLRIGFQLAARRPELFDLEQIRIDVQQRIGTAEIDSNIVGAKIERIRASPFHQTVIRIRQEVERANGSILGLQIGEWIADPRLIDVDDLQQMALYAPARNLARLRPAARIVILIDALDELRLEDDSHNLLDWLTSCPPLPENVRIVLSSRPASGQLETFVWARRDSLAKLTIDASDARVQMDIRRYATTLVQPAEIATAVHQAGRTADQFIDDLTAQSDGNLGYVAALGRAFDHALDHPERRALLLELLEFDYLPQDIQELFAFFLRLIQNNPGRTKFPITDPQDGTTIFLEKWPQLYRPVLAALSVTLQPLSLDQIHALTNSLADRDEVVQAVGWLEQFLDRINDRYRLYHATFAAFLMAPDTHANPKTSDLWIDSGKEHRRIASLLEARGPPELIWQDCADVREQGRREYARQHYITHLYLGANWDRLATVIESGAYGQGKLRFDPSTYQYSRDLDLAIRATTRSELDAAGRLAELPRLWSFKLLRCSLSSYADRLPTYAFAALTLAGREREAMDLTRLVTDPAGQARALMMVASTVAQDPRRRDRASGVTLQACDAATRVENTLARSALFQDLLQEAWPLVAASLAQSGDLLEGLSSLARSFTDPAYRTEALGLLARELNAMGSSEQARELLKEIARIVDDAPEGAEKQAARSTFSVLSSTFGDLSAANAAAEMLVDSQMRISALSWLATVQHKSGLPEVSATVETLSTALASLGHSGPARVERNALWADLHLDLDDKAAALSALRESLALLRSDASCRVDMDPLLHVMRAFHRAGDAPGLAEAIGFVETEAISELSTKGLFESGWGALFSIGAGAVRALSALDQVEPALKIIGHLGDVERPNLLLEVLRSLVRQKDFDRALALADQIAQANDKRLPQTGTHPLGCYYPDESMGTLIVAAALALERQWPRALEVAQGIKHPQAAIDALSRIATLQFVAGLDESATSLVERIMKDVRVRDIHEECAEAFQRTAELFIRGRQLTEARAVADEIGHARIRAEVQFEVVAALVEAHDFKTAQMMLPDIQSGAVRAESLLMLVRKLYSIGGKPRDPADNPAMIRMLQTARGYAEADEDKVRSARALRSIAFAFAFAELNTGASNDAIETMMTAVMTLNKAPSADFIFLPSPWTDTTAAFATLGEWGIALRLGRELVARSALESFFALRGAAAVAIDSGDLEQAGLLLAAADAAADGVCEPERQSKIKSEIAGDYARAGQLADAARVAVASGKPQEAEAAIAAALLATGNADTACKMIDAIQQELSDSTRELLVPKLLAVGDIRRAESVAAAITEAPARAEQFVKVARHLLESDKKNDARAMTSRVLPSIDAARALNPYRAAVLLLSATSLFVDMGDFTTAHRLVEEQWLAARTREDLLVLLPLAGPLLVCQPDLSSKIHRSLAWVERSLGAA
jgi:tetratricopeptide (TPR) repeat protein